jgi:aryl-alcohol dehydrogenase-like predicted oxidoreductase
VHHLHVAGLQVSVIGLGLAQFGAAAWGWGRRLGPAKAREIIQRALELGVTLFDTAESYGDGQSERLLGEVVSGSARRASIVVASKVSPHGLTRERVRAAARESLARLGSGWIDLYQVHGMDWRVAEKPKMEGMRDLLAMGEVRHVGVSSYELGWWREAEAQLGRPVVSNQVRYSLLSRRPERELLPYAAANDRLLISWSPLEQGLLAGRYDASAPPSYDRASTEYFSPVNLRRAEPVVTALREVGARYGATPAQVALAWIIHHPNVVAIPGATSLAQVEENVAAADLELDEGDFTRLTEVSNRFRPVPDRSQQARLVARKTARRVRELGGWERWPLGG